MIGTDALALPDHGKARRRAAWAWSTAPRTRTSRRQVAIKVLPDEFAHDRRAAGPLRA